MLLHAVLEVAKPPLLEAVAAAAAAVGTSAALPGFRNLNGLQKLEDLAFLERPSVRAVKKESERGCGFGSSISGP